MNRRRASADRYTHTRTETGQLCSFMRCREKEKRIKGKGKFTETEQLLSLISHGDRPWLPTLPRINNSQSHKVTNGNKTNLLFVLVPWAVPIQLFCLHSLRSLGLSSPLRRRNRRLAVNIDSQSQS